MCVYSSSIYVYTKHTPSQAGETLAVFQIHVFEFFVRPWLQTDSNAWHANSIQQCRFKLPPKHFKTPVISRQKFSEINQRLGNAIFFLHLGLLASIADKKHEMFRFKEARMIHLGKIPLKRQCFHAQNFAKSINSLAMQSFFPIWAFIPSVVDKNMRF